MNVSVSARGLVVAFGDFRAVDGVSFSVSKGEIFGFLGANGAGKTTTIRALCGLLAPTEGELSVAGFSPVSEPDRVKASVGYMSQKFTLYHDLTIRENLEFAAGLRKLDKKTFRSRVRELFEFTGFSRGENELVKNLPGGERQQLALTACLLHSPEVIFLDEPTAGVSPSSRLVFWKLIKKLSASGKTVFVTTHYMDEAEQCGRIAMMQAGKIIALDSPSGLKETYFKEPLWELEFDGLPPAERLRKIGGLEPCGSRWHLAVSDEAAWNGFLADSGGTVKTRRISPSLEDVFLRLMAT